MPVRALLYYSVVPVWATYAHRRHTQDTHAKDTQHSRHTRAAADPYTSTEKLIYRKELLDVKTSTMFVAETLRAQAKERKMKAGTMGLAQGHHPHVLDAAELLRKAWAGVTATNIARSGLNMWCRCSCKY